MTFVKAVAKRLNNLIISNNISQYRFIKNSGMEKTTFQNIIKEKTSDIRLSTIYIIASTFNISLKEFFNDKVFDHLDFEELK